MSKNTEKTIQISEKEYEHFVDLEKKISRLTEKYDQKFSELQQEIENRDEWIKLLKKALYGKKSEKSRTPDVITVEHSQLTIFEVMDGVDVVEIENEEPDDGISDSGTSEKDSEEHDQSESQKKKSKGRRKLGINLPEREVILDVPEKYRKDENGEPLVLIVYEISERLNFIPSKLERLVYKREVLGYKDSRQRVIVAAPQGAIIPKGKLTDEFIHHIAFEKYHNGMPLCRQLKSLNAQGAGLSKSTMSDAIKEWSALYDPVAKAVKEQVFKSKYIHADESPLKHKTKEKKYKNGYMFVYRDTRQAYFYFGENRSQAKITNVLGSKNENGQFPGYLMCDGYAGYNVHTGKRLACWAHARRQFYKLAADNSRAKHLLKLINKLYRVEKKLTADQEKYGWSEEEFFRQRFERRNSESRKYMDELKEKLLEYENLFTPKSTMGKAITYVKNRWSELQVFLEDGCLPVDNNAAERSIRSMVIGRKNYLFAGSKEGGEWAANAYTIMESCRLQELDPRDYMRAVTPLLIEGRDDPDFDYHHLTPLKVCKSIREIRKMLKSK